MSRLKERNTKVYRLIGDLEPPREAHIAYQIRLSPREAHIAYQIRLSPREAHIAYQVTPKSQRGTHRVPDTPKSKSGWEHGAQAQTQQKNNRTANERAGAALV